MSKKFKPKVDFYLTHGNRKLVKGIIGWSLPAILTCRGSGICKKFCYSLKAEKQYANARESRKRNLEASRREDFEEKMIEILKWHLSRGKDICRVHIDGDFYNQAYADKWRRISKAIPDMTFYAYTKSFDLDFSKYPSNFVLIQSYGSRWDEKINVKGKTARVIFDEKEKKPYEYLCPYEKWKETKDKKFQCGDGCRYCMTKGYSIHVVFLAH